MDFNNIQMATLIFLQAYCSPLLKHAWQQGRQHYRKYTPAGQEQPESVTPADR